MRLAVNGSLSGSTLADDAVFATLNRIMMKGDVADALAATSREDRHPQTWDFTFDSMTVCCACLGASTQW